MPEPFVSVLIDTYNHERFIEEAVNSVLAQDFPASGREILVVDDGSTDHTPEILKKFEPHIRILRKTNGGQASAFNHGIPECRGEVIASLDGDDWWAPGKLRMVSDTMKSNPSLGMLGHSYDLVQTGRPPEVIVTRQDLNVSLRDAHSAEIFRLHRPYLGTSRLVLRAHVARQCLPVPEALVFEADEYLFTVAAAISGGLISTQTLTHYRIHGGNLSVSGGGSTDGARRKRIILEALSSHLRRVLPPLGVPPDAMKTVLEAVDVEAAHLRLSVDEGWSWEVFRTETALYRMLHADASRRSVVFRWLSMIPALLLPPRYFYGLRRFLSSQTWYSRVRNELVPIPRVTVPVPPPDKPVGSDSNPDR